MARKNIFAVGLGSLSLLFAGNAMAQDAQTPEPATAEASPEPTAAADAPSALDLAAAGNDAGAPAPTAGLPTRADVAQICREVDNSRRNFLIFSQSRNSSTVDEGCLDYAVIYLMLESDNPDNRVIGYMAYARLNPAVQEAIQAVGQRYGVDVTARVVDIALSMPAGSTEQTVCTSAPGGTLGNTTYVCRPATAAAAAAPAETAAATETATPRPISIATQPLRF